MGGGCYDSAELPLITDRVDRILWRSILSVSQSSGTTYSEQPSLSHPDSIFSLCAFNSGPALNPAMQSSFLSAPSAISEKPGPSTQRTLPRKVAEPKQHLPLPESMTRKPTQIFSSAIRTTQLDDRVIAFYDRITQYQKPSLQAL